MLSVLLSGITLFSAVTIGKRTQTQTVAVAEPITRTVALSETCVEAESILEEFDNASLTTEGATTYFEGFKTLDLNSYSMIDYISEDDLETLEDTTVKYNFSYNSETNIVTIAAAAELPDGSIEIDEIQGVGFINDDGDIDAVMNVDGESLLLSEMREAGLIENCGWFSKLVKKVAKVVTVAAVVVVAAAVVVATAGAAAPAVVAAGVGVAATTVTTAAATIAAYATVTAAIAAGVTITVEMWERYYPGIKVEKIGNTIYAKDYDSSKKAIKDIVETNKKRSTDPKIYFSCVPITNKPTKIDLNNPYTFNEMKINMATIGMSSVTYISTDAYRVIRAAVPSEYPVYADEPETVKHYHAVDIFNSGYNPARTNINNPRYQVAGKVLHSFWF